MCPDVKDRNSYRARWINSLKIKGLKPNIEIIDIVPKDQWEFWEQYWISQFKTWGFNLVNTTIGGGGICDGFWKGKKRSEETIKKLSESHKGIKLSAETIKKMSERMKNNHPMKGKKHTEETRNKIKKSWETRVLTKTPELTRLKKSESAKKDWIRRREVQN